MDSMLAQRSVVHDACTPVIIWVLDAQVFVLST